MLIITSSKDPLSKTTWSGTPKNVINALDVEGIEYVTCSSQMTIMQTLVVFTAYQLQRGLMGLWGGDVVNIVRKYRSDFRNTKLAQQVHYQQIRTQISRMSATHILHMASDAYPPIHDGLSHAVLVDTTWHVNQNTLDADRRFGKLIFSRMLEQEKNRFHRMSRIFSISEYVARDLIEFYGVSRQKITVVGTGMGQPFPQRPKDYRSRIILFAAKLRFEEKGGQLLFEAFQRIRAKMPDAKLIFVGQEWYPEKFAGHPGIEAYGHVSFELLQELYARASIFAMPALVEPWGLVYLEALSNGLPVLGLRRMALPEITEEGRFGFLVDEATPEAVAAGLIEALGDPEKLERMGNDSRQVIPSRYSWSRVADAVKAWLEEPVSPIKGEDHS